MFASIVLEGTALATTAEGAREAIGPKGYLFTEMPAGQSLYAPFTVMAETELTVFSMRVLRLAKLCSFRCVFHAKLLENLSNYFYKSLDNPLTGVYYVKLALTNKEC